MSRSVLDVDEDLQPFEQMAADAQKAAGQKRSASAANMSQRDIRTSFASSSKTALKGASKDDDSSSDDDEDPASFFQQHRKTEIKGSKIKSIQDSTKVTAKKGERKLLTKKYPRGMPTLKPDWDARFYRSAETSKEYWVYSHPVWGETTNYKDMSRSKAEWKAVKEKRSSGGGTAAAALPAIVGGQWQRKKRDGGGAASPDDDEEEEDDAAGAAANGVGSGEVDDDDPLSALLMGKKKREEDVEAMKERVHEEMSQAMDTGVKVNPLLKKLYSKR